MRIALLFLGAALLCFCGCRSRLVQTDSPRSDPDGAKVEVVAVQYVPPVGTMEDLTVEILLHNRGSRPVTFVGAELNGAPLPPIRGRTQEVLQAFDVEGLPVRRSFPKPVAGVRWWQFYPSATLQANGFAAFQVNFAGRARPSRLELTTADGAILSAAVSAYYPVVRRIVHLGVTGDGGRISVAHSAGEPPTSVRLNGAAVPFRALRPADAGRAGAVIAAPPRPIREGEPLLVELGFADGVRCFGLGRALRGIFTVAPDGWNESRALPEAVRNRYGFDEGLRVGRLPLDAVCDDARAGVCGASSRELVGARCARFRAKSQELCGVDICTALQPSSWNIYAPLADAVLLKPYKMHWGANAARFIGEEVAFLGEKVAAVAPRPAVWIPERFREGCELEGTEFEMLAWSALLQGVRGIRIHHWMNDRREPFAGNPGLAEAVVRFNAALNRKRRILESLVPAGMLTVLGGSVQVLEGWCADEGTLLLVRNLDYETGIDRKSRVRRHPFGARRKLDVPILYMPPPWLKVERAVDSLSGEVLKMGRKGDSLRITLPELTDFRLIYLPNAVR